ncbi:MBG domain-containing protein, partial [Sunxiuqinia sp. sy24]|uniref:MBG domain-containing protein n=1 Tax=Sunxiuqinia sp. sy24 TaxID=3461495 RepID=UPI004045C479
IKQNTLDNANYNIAYTSADLTIGQLAVTVTADAQSKTYGELDPALTFVSVPAVGSTLPNGEVIAFTGKLSRDAGETVGNYAIKQNTLDNANYNIAYTSADLTIGQLEVTVTADAMSKTYGELDPALTFVSNPAVGTVLANGEVIAFTGALSRDPGETVGNYAIRQNTLDNANYNIAYTSADLTIGQLAVTVTADAKRKYCGQIDPTLTFVSDPAIGTILINGEVIGFSGAIDRMPGEDVGSHTILQGSLENTNYAITYIPAILSIAPVAIDASASSQPVAVGSSATLRATVVDENNLPIEGVAVTFIVTSYDENNQEQLERESTVHTNTNGIAAIPNVSVPEVKVYKVTAMAGEGCSESVAYLPVYDPSAGFVTGGGWFWSPEGTLAAAPTAVGKANFGFNAKYKKGNKEVDGHTEFHFKAGELKFNSSSHDAMTLVIANFKATYKGKGSINGEPGYAFMVSVIDGDVKAKGDPDLFRIKIWVDGSPSDVVYDNQLGVDENADATTLLGGGSIVIHEVKNNRKTAEIAVAPNTVTSSFLAYPNPFTDRLKFEFSSPVTTTARLDMYDANGRLVKVVFDQPVEAGVNYNAEFAPNSNMSNLYIYRLTMGSEVINGKAMYTR